MTCLETRAHSYSLSLVQPFVVSGVASFIPITLEQLARDSPNSVLLSDKSKSCHAQTQDDEASKQCVISLLGLELNTASFAMYTFSISVLVQALLIISMSGAADHGQYRKSLLLGFAFAGAIATMLYLPVGPQVYVLGAMLAIVSNTCFGASFVLLNSFLPLLVRRSQSVEAVAEDVYADPTQADAGPEADTLHDHDDSEALTSSTSALLPGNTDGAPGLAAPGKAVEEAALQLSTRISGNGIGIGYIAAFIVQSLALFVVNAMQGTLMSLRTVLFIVGAWWFIFTIPTAFLLRPRPGPSLKLEGEGTGHLWLKYLTHSWKSLGKTVLRARRLKDLMLFLGAWFLLSDGKSIRQSIIHHTQLTSRQR